MLYLATYIHKFQPTFCQCSSTFSGSLAKESLNKLPSSASKRVSACELRQLSVYSLACIGYISVYLCVCVCAVNIPLALPTPPGLPLTLATVIISRIYRRHFTACLMKTKAAAPAPTLGAHRHLNCSHVALCKVPEKAAVILTLFAGSTHSPTIPFGNNNVNNINNAFIPQQRAAWVWVRERGRDVAPAVGLI